MIWSLRIDQTTIVPFGLPDFKGKAGPSIFVFELDVRKQIPSPITFEVLTASGTLLHTERLGESILGAGKHKLTWDGFDLNDVFDTRIFQQTLEARLVSAEKSTPIVSVYFTCSYVRVAWLDIIIHRKEKKIDAILRTSFRDGGASTREKRSRTYHELLQLAQEGVSYHWGRNAGHMEASFLRLPSGEHYDFYVHVENVGRNALKSPKIIYQCHARVRRSRNWELSRLLFYNTGALKYGNKWFHKSDQQADADFKQIAAHEIGHEILLAFGGHIYSKSHKGSATILTQRPLGNFFYPAGEIDLMIYYQETDGSPHPRDYNRRSAASNADVLGLIWLSQLKVAQLHSKAYLKKFR